MKGGSLAERADQQGSSSDTGRDGHGHGGGRIGMIAGWMEMDRIEIRLRAELALTERESE